MKVIADTLGVARSNLVVRAARGRRARLPYRKAGDPELLARIRALVDQRPTYGYRRITALLNRERASSGGPNVNHKRVFRPAALRPAVGAPQRSPTWPGPRW